ncbi:hypothetical protein D9758_005601 [Tetrapyrgos nigripes]|uniref:Uncharacterized protein n=1 Tax=Tetrapyrgos nigripes TaxID=182062 RepID=A0A8H5GGL3_9AGAR|nr:hypothetical protein D9758_005601 [Tetrapyrgos nigripes]
MATESKALFIYIWSYQEHILSTSIFSLHFLVVHEDMHPYSGKVKSALTEHFFEQMTVNEQQTPNTILLPHLKGLDLRVHVGSLPESTFIGMVQSRVNSLVSVTGDMSYPKLCSAPDAFSLREHRAEIEAGTPSLR